MYVQTYVTSGFEYFREIFDFILFSQASNKPMKNQNTFTLCTLHTYLS